MNSNGLVITQKQKQTYNKTYIYDDWVSKPNCKIEFFVPRKGHQNCLDKSLHKDHSDLSNKLIIKKT